jgi:methyl-accepting chemotaxis protein
MTTKFKIISGFGIMIVLIAAVSISGVIQFQSSEAGFVLYRRYARVNVLSSNLSGVVSDVLRHLNNFLSDPDPKHVDSSLGSLDAFAKILQEARSTSRIEERLREIDAMGQRGESFRPEIREMRDMVIGLITMYNEQVRPAYNSIYKSLDELAAVARDAGNTDMLSEINSLWLTLCQAATSSARFSENFRPQSADESLQRLAALQKNLEAASAAISVARNKQKFGELMELYERVVRTVQAMRANAVKKDALVERVRGDARALNTAVETFSEKIDKESMSMADKIIQDITTAESILIGSSVIGMLIGLLAALVIIIGLTRVLDKLSAFASAVSEGNFEYQVLITEKGEIGNMVNAMRAIPSVLNDMLETFRKLAGDIQYGKLHSQADASRFRGGFSALIGATNNIVGNLRGIIDNIPTPVLMMNRETKAEYLNLQALEVAGSDGIGKTCRQLFNREDTDTPGDALKKAIDTKRPASAETRCRPRGKEMDISYSALPILDKDGNLTTVLQLITDLTAIKETERTIQNVATQASGISNRVAAASEELSAQVEQVSRGAETQRTRVESTASAMSEMNSTVLEVARNAGQASEQSGLTRDKAQNGAKLVNQVVNAINHVNAVASTLQNNMQELGSQAESIGGVMNVISDIADQTNLLALNAAIEAARAGEAGRGFAVVADEVRKLAEKTMSATQEVGSSISAIQQSAKSNIQEVGSAVSSIGEATDLANSSGEALKEIVDLAAANSSVVTSIATAAEEQSSTSEEINRAIEEINRIVNETTDGMVQSSAAVQELSQMAQELNRVMDQLIKH